MQELPKIETFEYDITNEIKTKEANIRDIAVSNGVIENKEEDNSKNKNMILISISAFLILISVISVLVYYLYMQNKEEVAPVKIIQKNENGFREEDLSSKLPFLYGKVGRFITKGEETPHGFSLTLDNYNEVFAFMLKNENQFSDELSDLLKVNLYMSTTSAPLSFTDVTVNNQNMRILTNGSSTIVYSFLNTEYLLLSTSTDAILSMRSAIIK